MAKAAFDIKTEAARPLYASVGATDRAVEVVRDYVAEVHKKLTDVQQVLNETVTRTVSDLDLQPQALRDQAVTAVLAGAEALSKDAKARRAAIEARVSDLQAEAQTRLVEGLETMNNLYAELAQRGELVVARLRSQTDVPAAPSKPTVVKQAGKPAAKPAAKSSATKSTATKATATKASAKKAPSRSAGSTGSTQD